jgi:hypothetical protein
MAEPQRQPEGGRRDLVSWRLYRVLLVAALLLVVLAALAVQHLTPPPPPDHSIRISGASVMQEARDISAAEHSASGTCCEAGSAGELAGAQVMAEKLQPFDHAAHASAFAADLPWRSQPVPMANVVAYAKGAQPGVIAVVAHRDGDAVETAVSQAMLVELSRALKPVPLRRSLVLISTDGGSTGGQGAAHFATTSPVADQVVAAITLESVAGPAGGGSKLLIRSNAPRGTSSRLITAIRQAAGLAGLNPPAVPGVIDQMIGYAVPYAPTEQSPLIAHQIPAAGVTAAGGPKPRSFAQVDQTQLGETATAIAQVVQTLDSAPSIDQGGSPALYSGSSAVRAWLIQVALIALLVPTAGCVLVLVAAARRRRVPLAPGMWALGWRVSTWLVGMVTMWALTIVPGRLLPSVDSPPLPHRTGVTWAGVLLVVLIATLYWRFVSRPRLVIGITTGSERTVGFVTGLLGLLLAGVLLAAINPYVLILIIPAAHAWLWVASASRAGIRAMLIPYAIGFLGLLVVLFEMWHGQGVGAQTPAVVIAMLSSGYMNPAVTFCLAIAGAAACQIGSLVVGLYSPVRPR